MSSREMLLSKSNPVPPVNPVKKLLDVITGFSRIVYHQRRVKGGDMKSNMTDINDELSPEYEFDYSKAERGKYFKRLLKEGANVVILEPDISKFFTSSDAVNDALRSFLQINQSTHGITDLSV
jgi:hypothetical protein